MLILTQKCCFWISKDMQADFQSLSLALLHHLPLKQNSAIIICHLKTGSQSLIRVLVTADKSWAGS